jgi:hypothetical protein
LAGAGRTLLASAGARYAPTTASASLLATVLLMQLFHLRVELLEAVPELLTDLAGLAGAGRALAAGRALFTDPGRWNASWHFALLLAG